MRPSLDVTTCLSALDCLELSSSLLELMQTLFSGEQCFTACAGRPCLLGPQFGLAAELFILLRWKPAVCIRQILQVVPARVSPTDSSRPALRPPMALKPKMRRLLSTLCCRGTGCSTLHTGCWPMLFLFGSGFCGVGLGGCGPQLTKLHLRWTRRACWVPWPCSLGLRCSFRTASTEGEDGRCAATS